MAQYTLKNKDIIKGGHLMVFVDNEPIAFATSHSLNKTLNTNETATKDHGDYAAVLPQNISWEVTTENLYSLNGYKKLNKAFNKKETVTLIFGESSYDQNDNQASIVLPDAAQAAQAAENWETQSGGFYESGQAYITSLQVTAPAGENATFSATFTGSGDLTETGGLK